MSFYIRAVTIVKKKKKRWIRLCFRQLLHISTIKRFTFYKNKIISITTGLIFFLCRETRIRFNFKFSRKLNVWLRLKKSSIDCRPRVLNYHGSMYNQCRPGSDDGTVSHWTARRFRLENDLSKKSSGIRPANFWRVKYYTENEYSNVQTYTLHTCTTVRVY